MNTEQLLRSRELQITLERPHQGLCVLGELVHFAGMPLISRVVRIDPKGGIIRRRYLHAGFAHTGTSKIPTLGTCARTANATASAGSTGSGTTQPLGQGLKKFLLVPVACWQVLWVWGLTVRHSWAREMILQEVKEAVRCHDSCQS